MSTEHIEHAPACQAPTHTPDGRPYRVFFICGHMRSGTTWVRNLMNLHPDVNCQSEGPFGAIADCVDRVKHHRWLTSSRDDMPDILDACLADFASAYTRSLAAYKPDASWIGDHTSRPLRVLMPDSPHMHILRDGRDVLTSWTFHQLKLGFEIGEPMRSEMAPLVEAFRKDPNHFYDHPEQLFSSEAWVRHSARGWKLYFERSRQAIELAKRPGTAHSAPVLELRYEELVEDTKSHLNRMFDLLGLDPADAEPISKESKTMASFWKENPTWFYRAGKVGDWKNYATDPFKQWFKEEAGDALQLAGYESDNNW